MYVYLKSDQGVCDEGGTFVLYTVGFFDPDGQWHAESDHDNAAEAAKRVAYLNGANVSLAE